MHKTETILAWLSYKRHYKMQDLGYALRDLAYDIVAELFAGEQEQCCPHLRHALAGDEERAGEDLVSAFDAILYKNVHQHLSRIFGEINPLYQQLLRSLRGHIYRSSDIASLDTFDGRWYLRKDLPPEDLAKPPIPIEELRRSLHLGDVPKTTPVVWVFRSVLATLDAQDMYRKSTREADILLLTKESLGMDYTLSSAHHTDPEYSYDAPVLGRILLQALDAAMPWIEERYLEERRLTSKEVDCFLSAIRMYFNDLMGEGETLGPYTYLRRCMPGLTHARFRESYRRKFENILQRVFNEAYTRLGKDASLLE